MNILLIEDDAKLVELMTIMLEELGFSVTPATSGTEVLAQLKKQTPDLMLLDYSLPDINGKELVETLNKQHTPPPPFIITTKQGNERIALDMMKLGAMDYLVKDILFLEKLPNVINRVIKEIKSDDKLKQAEKLIEIGESRYRELVNTINSGIVIYKVINDGLSGRDYIIEEFNAFALSHENKLKENVIGKTLKNIRPNIDDSGLINVFRKVWKSGKSEFFPAQVYRDDNFTNYYENRVFKLPSGEIVAVYDDVTEKKRAEEQLKESEERFRKLIDNMPSGVAIYKAVDTDFEFIDLNKKAEEITNTSRKEIIGHTLLETFPNMKNGPFVESLKKISKDGITISLPPFFYKDDQRQGWRENTIYKLASSEIVAIFKDVTTLKETEEQLKRQNIELLEAKEIAEESNERFNLAMNAAKDGLYDWNLETNKIYYSPRWKSMLGYNDNELPNDLSVWENLTEAVDAERSWKMQHELINRQRDRFELEFKMKHKDGHWIDVLSRAEAVFDKNNKAIRMVGTHVDITERKQSELELIKSEEKYRAQKEFLDMLINTIPSPIFYKDLQGKFIGVNSAFTNFVGISAEDIIGKSVFDISPKNIAEKYWDKDKELLENPGTQQYEWKIENKEGKIHDVIFDKATFTDSFGRVKGFIGIITDISERKHSEEKIRAAEENLQNTFDISPNIIAKANLNTGYYIEANQAVTRLLGYSVDEFISKPFIELIHPDDKKQSIDKGSGLLKGQEMTFFENRYLCKDGSYKWLAWHGTKANENGIVTAIGGDINDRKIAEVQLLENEEKYRTMIETSNDLIWMLDKKGDFAFINAQTEKTTGYLLNDLKGKSFIPLVLEDELPFLNTVFAKTMSGERISYEMGLKTADGDTLILAVNTAPLFAEGKIQAMFSFARDITQQKEAERLLKDSEKRFKALHNASFGGISIHDKGLIKDCNQGLSDISGYPLEELIGMDGLLCIAPDSREIVRHFIETAYEKAYEVVGIRKNGEEFPLMMQGKNIPYEGKNMRVVEFRDITQQKITESELNVALEKALESDRLKSAFLANMSHEIRTPMNGILGFITLLNEPDLSKAEINEYSDIINKSSDLLLNTINDIIDISKIEAGEVVVSNSEISINDLMDELLLFHTPDVNKKGLSLILETSAEIISTQTDSHKLHGILTNLIKNATKFTDTGSITFGAVLKKGTGSSRTNEVEFFVKDSGIGIPENRIHAIFNRFEQADIEDMRAFEGSGLGLAISKAYTEMLGGKMFVESEEGNGSKFSFTIPYTQCEKKETHKQPEDTDQETSRIKSLNLLIVEDDNVSAELLKILFKNVFRKTIYVKNGIDAIEISKNNPDIDLVLMDIKMPLMNGFDTTREIRKFNKTVVIIAQTAYALVGDKEKAIEAGCNDYISKPIDKQQLITLIHKHINKENS